MSDYIIHNFLLLSISTISYLLYLFPLSCFDDVVLSDTQLKKLNGNSLESKRLLEHIEKGLFESIEKGFAKSIIFYIFYELDDFDIFTIEILNSSSNNKYKNDDFKNYIIYNFSYIIRSLIDFILNDKRQVINNKENKVKYCSIKLIYNINCDNSFIPQSFEHSDKLSHINSYNISVDETSFDTIYESIVLNTGIYNIKLKCERRRK